MVYVYLGEGFEEIEALTCVDLLRRAEIEVSTVSVGERIVTGAHGIKVTADMLITEASMDKCQMIILPGGMPGTLNLQNNPTLSSYIDDFYKEGKYIAAICAMPTVLGKMGYLKDKNYTCFKSMNEGFGGTFHDVYCIKDDKFITGMSAAAAIDFAFLILETLTDKTYTQKIKDSIYYKN